MDGLVEKYDLMSKCTDLVEELEIDRVISDNLECLKAILINNRNTITKLIIHVLDGNIAEVLFSHLNFDNITELTLFIPYNDKLLTVLHKSPNLKNLYFNYDIYKLPTILEHNQLLEYVGAPGGLLHNIYIPNGKIVWCSRNNHTPILHPELIECIRFIHSDIRYHDTFPNVKKLDATLCDVDFNECSRFLKLESLKISNSHIGERFHDLTFDNLTKFEVSSIVDDMNYMFLSITKSMKYLDTIDIRVISRGREIPLSNNVAQIFMRDMKYIQNINLTIDMESGVAHNFMHFYKNIKNLSLNAVESWVNIDDEVKAINNDYIKNRTLFEWAALRVGENYKYMNLLVADVRDRIRDDCRDVFCRKCDIECMPYSKTMTYVSYRHLRIRHSCAIHRLL